tara:strand:+ start:7556 stop:8101 length:546 start_codon:yes stop_codon:yes gene_type:complete
MPTASSESNALESNALESYDSIGSAISTELRNGIPSHNTIGRAQPPIKPEQFRQATLDWYAQFFQRHRESENRRDRDEEEPLPAHAAIDGEATGGPCTNVGKSNTIHFPHAWAARHEATLGQAEVGSRTNEITAIHELLGFIDVRGTIISLDAIGAQKSITEKVHSNDGDCILASKDNCPG